MNIKYNIAHPYGQTCRYPLDEGFKEAHMLLTGRKSLSVQDMQAYKLIGFSFEEQK